MPKSRNASFNEVFWSVEALRWPMIRAQLTSNSPAGNWRRRVPGTRRRQFPAGEFEVSCALIIGQRKASTDQKTSLNEALRDFGLSG